jgi:hypothetical protein
MATNSLIFDTYKAVSSLRERGLSKEAAEGITNLVKDVTENNLVTKVDLASAVESLRTDVQRQMHELKVSLIQWMIGIQLGYGALIIAVLALQ